MEMESDGGPGIGGENEGLAKRKKEEYKERIIQFSSSLFLQKTFF